MMDGKRVGENPRNGYTLNLTVSLFQVFYTYFTRIKRIVIKI
jgi:hypothetical protein